MNLFFYLTRQVPVRVGLAKAIAYFAKVSVND